MIKPGVYKVTCYGMAKWMNLLGDKKIISKVSGFNQAKGVSWGFFTQEQQWGSQVLLNYNDWRNSKMLCNVVDVVNPISPLPDCTTWEGFLYYNGKRMFKFKLTRIGDV